MGTQITLVGNTSREPELRFSQAGTPVLSFGMAVNERRRNAAGEWEDGDTSWFEVVCFNDLAENVAESIPKGARVIVVGNLKIEDYETKDGGKGRSAKVIADSVGPDLRWAIVPTIEKSNGHRRADSTAPATGPAEDEPDF